MKLSEKFREKDIVYDKKVGINSTTKVMIRIVTIKYIPDTKKGKAIGQILDGIRRLL
jgi:hypothetical protein